MIVLLTGSTIFCYAQDYTPSTSSWSIGIQAAAQRYDVRYPITGINEIGIIPAQLVAGYRFAPRLLIQVGAAYRRNYLTSSDETYRHLAMPLTVRYTVSRNLDKRLLLDIAAGVGIIHSKHNFTRVTNAMPRPAESIEEEITKPFLTFGLSGRYRFSSHIEGVADLLLNKTTQKGTPFTGGFFNAGRFYNAALGIRYNF